MKAHIEYKVCSAGRPDILEKKVRCEKRQIERIVIPPPKEITKKWFEKMIRELNLTALQITMARILLRTNGRNAMLQYLESIAKEKAA